MSTFCVLPYYGYETTFANPKNNIYCCRLAPNTDINQVREAISHGKKHPACKVCWDLESSGHTSERIVHNTTFDYLTDCDIERIEQDALRTGPEPLIIKLATSNICNSTCVTCGPELSTAWAKLKHIPINYTSDNYHHSQVNWKKIVSLSFVGGEPLLEKENINILKTLAETGNTKCFISIVTNGSIKPSDGFLSLLKNFVNLNICVSIDGVGPVFEYLRYPLSWHDVVSNIAVFKEITNNVSVSYMVSNINLFYHSQTVKFFDDNQLNWVAKPVVYPNYYSPGVLSEELKTAIIANNTLDVSGFIGAANDRLFANAVADLTQQDATKGINIKDFLPEIYKYLL